jgi:hypothetical protein
MEERIHVQYNELAVLCNAEEAAERIAQQPEEEP